MNRYVVLIVCSVIVALSLVSLMTWAIYPFNVETFWLAVHASLVEDIVFFGLVGTTVLIYQASEWRGDSVRKRVERVFANKKLSHPAIGYIESIIHRNSVYAVEAVHRLVVLEYDQKIRAYRVEFHNRYRLRNLFGDLDYNFDFSATVAPDLVMDGLSPLGSVLSVRLTNREGTREFLPFPSDLTAEGFVQPVRLELKKNEEATFDMEWWSWATNVGNSGFSIKRFSEKTHVEIENRSQVTVRVFKMESPDEIITIPYRAARVIREETNVPERTRLDFSWLPPVEFAEERSEHKQGAGVHPILLREDKI